MAKSDAAISQLETQYCPPLDSATFLAILSDFNINNEDELQAVRQILDTVTETVDVEEASGFDPSGSSGLDVDTKILAETESDSGCSHPGWSSHTDNTSLSQGMSAFDLEGLDFSGGPSDIEYQAEGKRNNIKNYSAELGTFDGPSKEALLIETFPGIKPFDIKWTLKKCKGNAELASEELLNQVFLEDGGHKYRGIEAFSEGDRPERSRKGKGRKKRARHLEGTTDVESKPMPSGPMESKWEIARRDVEFISSRSGMPPQQVSALYHQHGSSVPATITAIIRAHSALNLENSDPAPSVVAQDLRRDLPTIPPSDLLGLARLTHPYASHAHDLAIALLPSSSPPLHKSTPIKIEFRLPPPPDLVSPSFTPKLKPHKAVYGSDHSLLQIGGSGGGTGQDSADQLIRLRNDAFARAAASYRRSKSDHLMGGAAVHYSTIGHTYASRARDAIAAEADERVAGQSTSSTLDLHGVGVKDAVRIVRESVESWWASVLARGEVAGDGKSGGGHTGYKIVTGKGTHSVGGKGRLGPAVGRMLMAEGWKVEVGSGALVVTGVTAGRI